MLNPIRLSKSNEAEIERLVKESVNPLLKPALAVNLCIEKGLPAVRKLFVKKAKRK